MATIEGGDGVFAQRSLSWDGKHLLLTIHSPRPHPDGDWASRVQIDLLPGGRAYERDIFGVDSWQCLEMANIELQDIVRKRFPNAYRFAAGDECFAFIAASALPAPFAVRLRRHLAAENERMTAALWEEALREKRRREGRPGSGDEPR